MNRKPTLSSLIVVLTLAGAAAAQTDPREFWSPQFQPWTSPATFEAFLDTLPTAAMEQREALSARYADLIGAYRDNFEHFLTLQERARHDREAWEAANPDTDPWTGAGRDFGNRSLQYNWGVDRIELETAFEADFTGLLDDDDVTVRRQASAAPRRPRVLSAIGQWRQGRAIADLAAVLEKLDLGLDEQNSIAEPYQAYVVRLDELLRSWEQREPHLRFEFDAGVGRPLSRSPVLSTRTPEPSVGDPDDQYDREHVERIMAEIAERTSAARDLTESSAHGVAALLPLEHAEAVLRGVASAAYPNVFARSPVDALVTLVRKEDWIDADACDAVEAVYQEYAREVANLRDRMVAAIHEWEHPSPPEQRRRQALLEAARASGGNPSEFTEEHPVIALVYERRDLTASTMMRLRTALHNLDTSRFSAAARILLAWPDNGASE